MAGRLWRFDQALRRERGRPTLIGVDEAGRGPLAGPVVAAAVVLPSGGSRELAGVRDSKTLSAAQRERLFSAIRRNALQVAVGWALSEEIDRINILQASLLAMRRALARLRFQEPSPASALLIVDGNRRIPEVPLAQEAIIGGDRDSLSIASAGIVAKVVRDRWMNRLDGLFPGYGFARHKGYGTPEHLGALRRLGPSRIHRRSFAPVLAAPRQLLEEGIPA